MSWTNVDDKHKKKYDGYFVACDEKYEREYIIKIIKEEFPKLMIAEIESAVESCCKSVPAPRPRATYMECLKKKLGV